MIITIIASILFGFLISTIILGIGEFAYNVKNNKRTSPETWIVPGIFAGLFWFFSHIY